MTAAEAKAISDSGVPRPVKPIEMDWIYERIKEAAHTGVRSVCFNKYSVSPDYHIRKAVTKELTSKGFVVSCHEQESLFTIGW